MFNSQLEIVVWHPIYTFIYSWFFECIYANTLMNICMHISFYLEILKNVKHLIRDRYVAPCINICQYLHVFYEYTYANLLMNTYIYIILFRNFNECLTANSRSLYGTYVCIYKDECK
jgi:hypothetical protein